MRGLKNVIARVTKFSEQQKILSLRRKGLYAEDLLRGPAAVRAIARLPFEVQQQRLNRRFRSSDLDLKKVDLPYELQMAYHPMDTYGLKALMQEEEARDHEALTYK
mmetsp:Transcript_5159/g.5919  ORF Transcript_5159/g.5919 Transcript_5159/m.5919 type:complete len:106 (+) Transcript_5159:27-344(+)|eukprot:CAMPEP_0205821506 /NCGR_PEP_ID=MMETSP0206-20130828/8109_1 /ASSEMBLY_ACC=CAM_ASM_000279 /TAXON_ID=36767 /ORGANISM="Euplotes focardii, Strain TN1" /LENGTH=105 /DNA_ID=CAMNT_0053117027 /DNA_START=27 /DNA_END=344 /DNA_ORIENTATION=+